MAAVAITNQSYTDTTGLADMAITGGTVYRVGLETLSQGAASLNTGSPVVARTGFRTSSIGQADLNPGAPAVNRTGMKSRSIGEANLTESGGRLQRSIGRTNSIGIASMDAIKATRTVNAPRLEFRGAGKTTSHMRRVSGSSLTVADAAREVLAVWGFEVEPHKLEFARLRVVAIINAAMQEMHSRAHVLDFFSLATFTVTVAGASNSIALSDSIQVIRGPVKLAADNIPLRLLASRGEFDNFVAFYYGDGDVPDKPRAYFIEGLHQNQADASALTLFVTPTPTDAIDVTFQAAIEPARYDENDILGATGLQMPNKFAESLFWPLLRYLALSDSNFRGDEAKRQDITTKYQSAMSALGLHTPTPPELDKPKSKASGQKV